MKEIGNIHQYDGKTVIIESFYGKDKTAMQNLNIVMLLQDPTNTKHTVKPLS